MIGRRTANFHPQPRPGSLYTVSCMKDPDSGEILYSLRVDCELLHEDVFDVEPGRLTDEDLAEVVEQICFVDRVLEDDEAEALFNQMYLEIGQHL